MTLCLTLHELWHSCRAGITEQGAHPLASRARLQQFERCRDEASELRELDAGWDALRKRCWQDGTFRSRP